MAVGMSRSLAWRWRGIGGESHKCHFYDTPVFLGGFSRYMFAGFSRTGCLSLGP